MHRLAAGQVVRPVDAPVQTHGAGLPFPVEASEPTIPVMPAAPTTPMRPASAPDGAHRVPETPSGRQS